MTALWKLLPLLVLMGCSADMAVQPVATTDAMNAAVLQQANPEENAPLFDIEPPDPFCVTNNTGFILVENTCRYAITCRVGNLLPFVINPGESVTEIVPVGAHDIEWWAANHCHYSDLALIARCETTELRFNAMKAQKTPAIQ
jgi:hypothetical protein